MAKDTFVGFWMILVFILQCFLFGSITAAAPYFPGQLAETINGPNTPNEFASWIKNNSQWRSSVLNNATFHFDDSRYHLPSLQWIVGNIVQPQMMIHDLYFYDRTTRKYTVHKYMEDVISRYGGIDSVLVWQSYPNIGIDNRNQFDMMRDMPGGIQGVRDMVHQFQSMGVSVLFPFNPWDNGTRDEGKSFPDALHDILKELGANGFNGDTCVGLVEDYFHHDYPLGIQPELGVNGVAELQWNVMIWGYWGLAVNPLEDTFVPIISTYKWLEPKHKVNICNRWSVNKTDIVQHALFNGVGFESWENVWGIWNGLTPRDEEAIRRVATILRKFSSFIISPEWEPYTPTLQSGIFSSKFPQGHQTLWTFVNRNQGSLSGKQIRIPKKEGMAYLDLYHGKVIQPTDDSDGRTVTLSFDIEGAGYGAILETNHFDKDMRNFLVKMSEMTATPLSKYSLEPKLLKQKMVPNPATPHSTPPTGTVLVSGMQNWRFNVSGNEIEGSDMIGVDVQYPWDKYPHRNHDNYINISSFYMDQFPVSNSHYAKFLNASGYKPADTQNFLKHWSNGLPPRGWEKKPVVWVDLEDARQYCKFYKKRLPNEWEWQYAAQGGDSSRLYPWGNQWDASRVPTPEKGRNMRPATNIDAYPQGRSSFQNYDLVGNVYQWTNEFCDEHTCAAIIRGGNYYQPQGSKWYLPQSYQLNVHTKFLLVAPGLDRSAGIGFRCAADKL